MATTLDGTWFAAHAGPPWVLSADNEVYTLAVDVDVPGPYAQGAPGSDGSYNKGELFKLTGQNSEFNPNGHYIRQNGRDVRQATRSGDKLNAPFSDYEKPVQTIDQLGTGHEWEVPQDSSGDRSTGDTGGKEPNTETGTGKTPGQPHAGDVQTGRGGRV